MERWRGRVAVVTGASAGIGAAIAFQLQDAGVEVVALARRSEKIPAAVEAARKQAKARGATATAKAATPGKLHSVKCDVSNEESILEAFKWVKDNVKRIDILVNNAGAAGSVELMDTNTEEWRSILDTNVLGLSICTREAIKLMREKNIDDGYIVHIGAVLGHVLMNINGLQMYSASKHAVGVLTEGLRKELVAAKSKIRVTEVTPGLVKTDYTENQTPKGGFLQATSTGEELWKKIPHLKPEEVADTVLYVLSTPPHVQIQLIMLQANGAP